MAEHSLLFQMLNGHYEAMLFVEDPIMQIIIDGAQWLFSFVYLYKFICLLTSDNNKKFSQVFRPQ